MKRLRKALEMRRARKEAVADFVKCWAAGDLAHDVAPGLTCSEVDALVTVIRRYGDEEWAELWIRAHSDADKECEGHDD